VRAQNTQQESTPRRQTLLVPAPTPHCLEEGSLIVLKTGIYTLTNRLQIFDCKLSIYSSRYEILISAYRLCVRTSLGHREARSSRRLPIHLAPPTVLLTPTACLERILYLSMRGRSRTLQVQIFIPDQNSRGALSTCGLEPQHPVPGYEIYEKR
jgi:hypothetical protein